MNITGSKLLELIPQRSPMVMIDSLLHCSEEYTQTGLTVTEQNIFFTNNRLNEAAIIENMAQTAAVRAGYLAKQNNEKVRKGFIGALKNVQIYFLPKKNDRLITKLSSIMELGDISVVKCVVTIETKQCAEAEFKIFLQD